MDEQKKEEVTELENQEAQSEEQQEKEPVRMPTRSYILQILAGIYLAYTGYRLCKNVLDGVEGGSWGFMVAGIIFAILGVGLVIYGARGMMQEDKRKKEEAQALGENPASDEGKGFGGLFGNAKAAAQAEEKKSMSIAERARLASRVEDEETSEEPEEKASGDEASSEDDAAEN